MKYVVLWRTKKDRPAPWKFLLIAQWPLSTPRHLELSADTLGINWKKRKAGFGPWPIQSNLSPKSPSTFLQRCWTVDSSHGGPEVCSQQRLLEHAAPPLWPTSALPSLSVATFPRTASSYDELSPRWILIVLSKIPVERIPDLRLSRYLKSRLRDGQDYSRWIIQLVSQWSISFWETVRNSVRWQKSMRGRSKIRLEVKDTC